MSLCHSVFGFGGDQGGRRKFREVGSWKPRESTGILVRCCLQALDVALGSQCGARGGRDRLLVGCGGLEMTVESRVGSGRALGFR